MPSSVLYRSDDGGATWSDAIVMARGRPQTRDYNEPAVLELTPGHLLAMHRVVSDRAARRRIFWQNESHDGGMTWTPPAPTESGACPRLLRLQDGRLLLTYGRRREPFGIYASLSHDDGRSWGSTGWLLRRTPDADQGYTSSVQLDATTIFTASYARNGRGVTGITGTFWRLP